MPPRGRIAGTCGIPDPSRSHVTDQGLALLRPENHKALEELDLSGCRDITDASVPLILKLKAQGLKRVRSSESGISHVGGQAIRNAGLELEGVEGVVGVEK